MDTNTIYLGDMRQGVELIPPESIDCIVTDPPYKTTRRGRPGKGVAKNVGGMLQGNGQFFEHQYEIDINDWFPLLYRWLKPGCHCYVFTNLLNLCDMLNAAKDCGFSIQNVLIWEKNNCTPSQYYMKNCEYVLLLRKGPARWINNQSSKTVHKYNNVAKKVHPCEKPVELLQLYIENSTGPGDLILDPFAGSGPTAVASIRSGRKFICFELDEKYHAIAMDRVKDELLKRQKAEAALPPTPEQTELVLP